MPAAGPSLMERQHRKPDAASHRSLMRQNSTRSPHRTAWQTKLSKARRACRPGSSSAAPALNPIQFIDLPPAQELICIIFRAGVRLSAAERRLGPAATPPSANSPTRTTIGYPHEIISVNCAASGVRSQHRSNPDQGEGDEGNGA